MLATGVFGGRLLGGEKIWGCGRGCCMVGLGLKVVRRLGGRWCWWVGVIRLCCKGMEIGGEGMAAA